MSYSKLSMTLLVKHSSVFPDEKVDIQALIKPYGRTLILQMVAVLNFTIKQGIKDVPKQLRRWFGDDNPLAREVFAKIYDGYRDVLKNGEKLYIINDYANLKLNDIALTFEDDNNSTTHTNDEVHLNLFKAYLVINEQFLLKQDNVGNTLPEGITGIDKAGWLATTALISSYDFTYGDEPNILLPQLIKANYCFKFLINYNPAAFDLYQKKLNIKNFIDYSKRILPLVNLALSDVVSFDVQENTDKSFLALYDHLQDIEASDENALDYDFLAIRNRPLFKISENRYLILNRSMIINKVYASIYWDMKAIFAANPQLNISQNKFRADYTTLFSEEFLFYQLMERAYANKPYKRFSGRQMKAIIGNTEPDYYVRNGNKLFLYEVKDSFIAGKYKQSFNATEIEKELKEKYFGEEGGAHEKAVKQLVTRIKKALLKDYSFDNQYNTRNLNIYPILVVYDINLTVPGVERILMNWFDQEILKLNEEMVAKNIPNYRVNNLVILHIDGLAMLSEYIHMNKLKMEDLIDNYLNRYRKLLKQRNGMTFEKAKTNVLASYLSFQHFVQDCLLNTPPKNRLLPHELRDLYRLSIPE